MRITNGIMINNNLSNINKNKVLIDKLYTNIESTKKLQKPSDDPIAAIRSLRLRSTKAQITQYLSKNVEDALSWMQMTDDALGSLNDAVTDITQYFNQGVSEYQTVEDRNKIITTLKEFRSQLYADGNADDAGRTIFTGYRTDDTLTFMQDTEDRYRITENIKFEDIRSVNKVVGVNMDYTGTYEETDISNSELHVVMLAYDNLDGTTPKIQSEPEGLLDGAKIITRSYGEGAYQVNDDEVVFIPETGELIIGNDYFKKMTGDETIRVTYEKTGFESGEAKPEHYFDCTKYTKNSNYADSEDYTVEDQEIEYNINFNQKVVVNVQAKDVLKPSLGRDLDIVIANAEAALGAHEKVDAINKKISIAKAAGNEIETRRLEAMLKAAELEVHYAEDNLTKSFSNGITLFQGHQAQLSSQMADLGSRMTRVQMNQDRLDSQKLTVSELLSENEDTDIAEAAVLLAQAQQIYDASLSAAGKVVQQSLLNFI